MFNSVLWEFWIKALIWCYILHGRLVLINHSSLPQYKKYGFVQKGCNSSALAVELCLFIKPWKCFSYICITNDRLLLIQKKDIYNKCGMICFLTYWGQATHICVGKLTIIGSDNGLSPGRCQAIIWTIAGILLIGPSGTNFSEILIGIQTFSFKKMHLKMLYAKWHPFVSASICWVCILHVDAYLVRTKWDCSVMSWYMK